MAEASEYVDLVVTLADASVQIPNYGSMCCAGHSNAGQAGLHKIAANPAGVAAMKSDLAFAETDALTKMIERAVAMTPHTSDLYVYCEKNEPATSLQITPQGPFTEGRVWAITINDVICTATAGPSADAESIATALHDQADVITGVSSTDNTGSFTLAETSAAFTSVFLSAYRSDRFDVVVGSSSAEPITDTLNNMLDANADIYGVCIDVDNAADLALFAAWCETNRKWGFARTKDAAVLDGLGVLDTIFNTGVHRTMVIYSEDDTGRLDAGLMARQLAFDPGASDAQFKRIPGVTRSQLTPTAIAAIKAKNGCVYTTTMGVSMTDNGLAVSGRPMAVTRNLDWLDSRIKQEVVSEFANSEIVILGTPGIAKMEKAIRTALEDAEDNTVLAPGWSLEVPTASDISTADKNAGLMKGFRFTGVTIVGTRKVGINGSLS